MRNSRLTLAVLAGATSLTTAHAATFLLTITNTGPQPLSPTFYSASDNTFNIFDLAGHSSAGIKAIAEGGNAAPEMSIASTAGAAVSTYGIVGGSPIIPGEMRSISFTTDAAHPYFEFAMMLGKTNDGFLGESYSTGHINLFSLGNPIGFTENITGVRAWDAGTELNTQNAADLGFLGGSGNPADTDNTIRIHDGVVAGVGDSWSQIPGWTRDTNLATVNVKVVPEPMSMLALLPLGGLLLRRKLK